MRCPACKNEKFRTIWVRHKDAYTFRCRECSRCGKRIITREAIDDGWDYKSILQKIYKEIKECIETEGEVH